MDTSKLHVDPRLLFSKEDHSEAKISSRWKVELEKLKENFPDAVLYRRNNQYKLVRFTIHSRFETEREISMRIPDNYPNEIPGVYGSKWSPVTHEGDDEFNHIYPDGRLCIQDDSQWSRDCSLALAIARTAKWVDKYEMWLNSGPKGSRKWPGSQHRI